MNADPNKLRGLPPIRYINLDRSPERRAFMEGQFEEWGIGNVHRFPAVDAGAFDIKTRFAGRAPARWPDGYLGCMISHFSLIAEWLETTTEPWLMVMEDDCNLEFAAHWPFDWNDFVAARQYNWDVLQLSVINDVRMVFRSHHRLRHDWSAACYVINRRYARKLVGLHRDGDRWRFDMTMRNNIENLLFSSGVAITTPLFSYDNEQGSLLHPDHVESIHVPSDELYRRFWTEMAPQITDWDAMFNPHGALDGDEPEREFYIATMQTGEFGVDRKEG